MPQQRGQARGDLGAAARLVVPEGLLIDETTRERLTSQLGRAPAEVVGIVAEVGALPPGASYRVHAEWRSLEPLSALVELPDGVARGAVLVRSGIEFAAGDQVVEVSGGTLLVDRGTHVHDPRAPTGTLRVAAPVGRPPFPRRPVVILAAIEPDDDLAEWARAIGNRLVRLGVEARLALPNVAEGLHLTRPCLPGPESVQALAPDAIVALDAGALAEARWWCGRDRSTALIELTSDPSMSVELVSWEIGHASGRLRGRIGRRVDATALAGLVLRLAAGPHPVAPFDDETPRVPRAVVRERWAERVDTRTTCLVVTGEIDDAVDTRVEGLLDHLEAAGVAAGRAPVDAGFPRGARTATVAVLVGVEPSSEILELVGARRDEGLATVLDLRAADLALGADAMLTRAALRPDTAELARACGMTTSGGGALSAASAAIGVRTSVLPTLLSRTRAVELRRARASAHAADGLVVGWNVGERTAPTAGYLTPVADALAHTLSERADVRVDIVGDPDRIPPVLRRHGRVVALGAHPEPERLAEWAMHVFAPLIAGGLVADGLGFLTEVSHAGVPSVSPLPARSELPVQIPVDAFVTDFEVQRAWLKIVRRVLDDDAQRARHAAWVTRWSDAVHDPSAARGAVNRFVGWARYAYPPTESALA